MYTPSHFALEDGPAAQRIMRKYNFATLVSGTQTDVMASHLPLLWTSQGGQYGSLRGHMARENPQWKQFADGGAKWRQDAKGLRTPYVTHTVLRATIRPSSCQVDASERQDMLNNKNVV